MLVSLAFAAPSQGAESAAPVKLRFGGDQSETRIVLEIAKAAQAEPVATDGQKLALSFSQLSISDGLEGQGRGLVKDWSLERDGSHAKLVLDLTRQARIKRRFLLPPSDGVDVYRYVVDLESDGAPAAPAAAATPLPIVSTKAPAAPAKAHPEIPASLVQTALATAARSAKDADDPPLKAAPVARSGRKVVVIDAGHGGHDPGALGGDLREKDLTLAAARTLKARLERTGKFKVVMTRESDVFVPLEKRVQIARGANADLFISLHADSGADASMRGATVYTLSDHGEDRAARSVFQGGSFLDVQLPGHDKSVKEILLDLTQRNTRNRSGAFAETLIDNVSQETAMVSRSHRDAGYMVLLAPDVPAVLLEMGFITNGDDQSDLNDPAHRKHLMNAVGNAIEAYFSDGLHIATR